MDTPGARNTGIGSTEITIIAEIGRPAHTLTLTAEIILGAIVAVIAHDSSRAGHPDTLPGRWLAERIQAGILGIARTFLRGVGAATIGLTDVHSTKVVIVARNVHMETLCEVEARIYSARVVIIADTFAAPLADPV